MQILPFGKRRIRMVEYSLPRFHPRDILRYTRPIAFRIANTFFMGIFIQLRITYVFQGRSCLLICWNICIVIIKTWETYRQIVGRRRGFGESPTFELRCKTIARHKVAVPGRGLAALAICCCSGWMQACYRCSPTDQMDVICQRHV